MRVVVLDSGAVSDQDLPVPPVHPAPRTPRQTPTTSHRSVEQIHALGVTTQRGHFTEY